MVRAVSAPPFLTLPPGVRRLDLETARGTFAALEALPGSRPPERHPALLVPGFIGSKEDFIAVLMALTKDGRRVFSFDQRGQYETPGSADPADYTCAALAADVGALLDELGAERVHLVGHSFGGLVAREAAIAQPSRLASVTIMSSGPAAISGLPAERLQALREALTRLELTYIWDSYLEPEAVADGRPTELIAFLRKRMISNSPIGMNGMINELVSAPDRVDALAKVIEDTGLPALVLFGADDDAWEPAIQAAMAARLGARKVVISGAGHSPAVDAPDTTASALNAFWTEVERTSS
jgi:pimeloyl-ACP methyl ester carboxylesterase